MSEVIRVFIGFDPRQSIAFQVCSQSVWEHASMPVSITRLDLRNLPIRKMGLTQFTYSRFLVPYLSGFTGYSLFLDSDILVRYDIGAMPEPGGESNVSMVMGEKRFEWPSVMLFNNALCTHMTPEYVQNEKCFDFAWARNPTALQSEWNHLVGYDKPNPEAKIVHFTRGVPVWKETAGCEFSQEWINTCKRMNSSVSHDELMGRSVHIGMKVIA